VRSERDKMLAGELYDPFDAELVTARGRARDLCRKLNATGESQARQRRRILEDLLGAGGDTVWMQPPTAKGTFSAGPIPGQDRAPGR
jgi:maltose O-acetyltransferase